MANVQERRAMHHVVLKALVEDLSVEMSCSALALSGRTHYAPGPPRVTGWRKMLGEGRQEARMYVGLARSTQDVEQAREVHTRTYSREGLITSLPTGVVFDDGWMNQRIWFIADRGSGVVGTVSLIRPAESLPTLMAFSVRPSETPRLAASWAECRVFEVSALAVNPDERGSSALAGLLYRALWRHRQQHLDHDVWVMSMRWERFDRLCATISWPFEFIGRTNRYYNGASVACMLDLRLARSALSIRAPALLAWFDRDRDDCVPRRSGVVSSSGTGILPATGSAGGPT
jgi:hypothetical protein